MMDDMEKFPELTKKGQETRQRILDTAVDLFARKGFHETTMRDIAEHADCSLGLTYRYFAQKDDLVIALYDQLAQASYDAVDEIGMGNVSDRFYTAMVNKLEQVKPHRAAFGALLSAGLNPEVESSVLNVDHIDPMRAVCRVIVFEANDKPKEELAESMATMLYTFYYLLLLFWLYDRTPKFRATQQMLEFMREAFKIARPMMFMPVVGRAMIQFAAIVSQVFGGANRSKSVIDVEIE